MNFIMMAIGSLYLLNVEDVAIAFQKQKVLVEVLISFVFIAFCGIIAFHILKALHHIPEIRGKMDWVHTQILVLSSSKMDFIKHKIKVVTDPDTEDGSVVSNEYWTGTSRPL